MAERLISKKVLEVISNPTCWNTTKAGIFRFPRTSRLAPPSGHRGRLVGL